MLVSERKAIAEFLPTSEPREDLFFFPPGFLVDAVLSNVIQAPVSYDRVLNGIQKLAVSEIRLPCQVLNSVS